jgi:hypothetical protein
MEQDLENLVEDWFSTGTKDSAWLKKIEAHIGETADFAQL